MFSVVIPSRPRQCVSAVHLHFFFSPSFFFVCSGARCGPLLKWLRASQIQFGHLLGTVACSRAFLQMRIRSTFECFLFFIHSHLLSSFGTSRGHRCRPFFHPVFAFNFYSAYKVQQSHCSSILHGVLLTHALALSASQFVRKRKVPTIFYEYALEGIRTHETDLYQARG